MPMLLPLLDVVFVGILGQDPGHIDRQVLSADTRLKAKKVAPAEIKALAANDDSSADVAKKLDADGVIVGELVGQGKKRALRVVIYNGAGSMTSMSEVPLGIRRTLNHSDLDVLKSNLGDEVSSLLAAKTAPPPKKNADRVVAKTAASDDPLASAGTTGAALAGGDNDDPLGGNKAAPKQTAAAPAAGDGDDANAVKASTDSGDDANKDATPSAVKDYIEADIGVGAVSRSFDPGPSTVPGYKAGTLPTYRLEGVGHPFAHATIDGFYEHTISMNTAIDSSSMPVPSLIARWELTAQYAVLHDKVDVAPMLGIGERAFAVDAAPMGRSPDGQYTYLVIGGAAKYSITPKFLVRAAVSFQPLVSGAEPTINLVGASTRWGLDFGAAAEYRITDHIFARAAADYQRIEWSWAAQNNVPAGTALDSYPTASIGVGGIY
jgi:hypothetical protein